MSRRSAGPQSVLAVATGVTAWVSLWAWGGFVQVNGDYLLPALVGIALIATCGALFRAARLPVVVVLAGQLLAVMLFANLAWGSSVLPTPDSLREAVAAFDQAVDSARRYAAPVPSTAPSIGPLLVLGGLLCHVLVDFLAVTLGRAPLSGLPLLTVYSLPVSVLDRSVSWLVFVATAIGFLTMLVVQESDRIVRWGRRLGDGTDLANDRTDHTPAVAVGASAISLALVLPVLIPTLDLSIFDAPGGDGPGGDRQVRITNPMTDLKRDLVQGPDLPLVRVRTADSDPSYLRISVLKEFNGQAWVPGGRSLPESQAADGSVPTPTGLSDRVPRAEVPWSLSVTDDLDSLWLPAPLYVKEVDAGGDTFRYDAETLDFHTGDNRDSTAGVDYTLTALVPELEQEAMTGAGPPPVDLSRAYTDLPGGFPQSVRDLAAEVTAGLTSDFDRGVALQEYFRENFTYSTDLAPGNGSDALVQFLFEGDMRGYCEQFASAMAVMARALDIPARVSVGLLDATRVGEDDVWEFSSRDMHAWPELYFEGFGWVMFEPTPQRRTGSVPSYTRDFDSGANPTTSTTTRPSTGPSSASPASPTPTRGAEDADADAQSDDEGAGLPLVVLLGGGGLLLLAGVALLPRALRRRRTASRWRHATDPAEAAWAELHDAALDLGVPWPTGRSPRAGAALLSREFAAPRRPDSPERPARGAGTNPEAVAAGQRIVAALELSRYAPPGAAETSMDEMRACVHTCVAALRSGVGRRARRRADWWPRSVLSARNGTVTTRPARSRPSQGVVDNLT